jgi:hypothetical protein
MMLPRFVLPDLILLADCGGNWETYLETVYQEFLGLYVTNRLHCGKLRLAVRRQPEELGKYAGFWHLVSEGKVEEDRLPDLRRSERIRWPRTLAQCVASHGLYCWKQKRREGERVLIATPAFDYVAVFAVRPDHVLLVTAFPVDRAHQQQRHRREWKSQGLASPW